VSQQQATVSHIQANQQRLSDLMCKGGKMKIRPTNGKWFDCYETSDDQVRVGEACPLGTAAIAAGLPSATAYKFEQASGDGGVERWVKKHLPSVNEMVQHPADSAGRKLRSVMSVVIDLTDEYEWSRKRVIAWLRKLGM